MAGALWPREAPAHNVFSLVLWTTACADSIGINGRGGGISIRSLSEQFVVKNDSAGRFLKFKSE